MAKSFKNAKTIKLFLDECREYLDTLDQDLVALEQGDIDEELLKRISRTVHTLKGSSAMLEYNEIAEISHAIEDVLDEFKKELPNVNHVHLDQIFTRADAIKTLVHQIESGSYGTIGAGAATAAASEPEPPVASKSDTLKSSPAPPTAPPARASEVSTHLTRSDMFEIAKEKMIACLERPFSIFTEIDGKYIVADENADNDDFYSKIFSSISYLQRSLVCYGEPVINEILAWLLILKEGVKAGKVTRDLDTLDVIFKATAHIKAIIDTKTAGRPPESAPDVTSALKKINELIAPVRRDRDYITIDSAEGIFEHLVIPDDIRRHFRPFEKRSVAKALIDSNNVFTFRMEFKKNELSDLASMSEFFRPMCEDGAIIAAFILIDGGGAVATDALYRFWLVYETKKNLEEIKSKHKFLTKVGGITTGLIDLMTPASESKPKDEPGQPSAADASVSPPPAAARKTPPVPGKKTSGRESDTTVRVDTGKLDILVDLIAELVISNNKLEQEIKRLKSGVNQLGELLDTIKFSAKTEGFAGDAISLDDLMAPFAALGIDRAVSDDPISMQSFRELHTIRENTLKLFDMELAKERIMLNVLSTTSGLKSEFDLLFSEFLTDSVNISRMIEELQDETMKLRMLPISGVFSKFPRRVRDIAKNLGKRINFKIEGEDTELDKTLIEEIEDPLLHIIRNSVDHGVETEADRRTHGKDPTGTIWARAYHEGNSVVIEVEDDGRGIDPEKVKRKAMEKRLISKEESDQMDLREALNLIFIPGFSTAEKVSDLSGRGVGMDVVKSSITKLKGTVELDSRVGRGTKFKLRLPLTLAIIQAMIVKCSDQKFVIPMDPIELTVQLTRSDIYRVEGKQVFKYQDLVLPLVHLRDIYDLPEGSLQNTFPVVIFGTGDKKIGLIVDEVLEKQQVVIKSLGAFLGDVKHITGATIFGDGSIAMILDVATIMQSIPYLQKRADLSMHDRTTAKNQIAVLLVDDSLSGRIAQREMLERIGYTVELASSGMQALNRLSERKFDVIVTDINMPRMDGYEFTLKVRSMPETRRIPVVMVTSDIRNADRNRAYDVGINEFLAKPFTEDDLRAAIEKHTRLY